MKLLTLATHLLILLFPLKVIGESFKDHIDWSGWKVISDENGFEQQILSGTNVTNLAEFNFNPYYIKRIPLNGNYSVKTSSFESNTEEITKGNFFELSNQTTPKLEVTKSGNQHYLQISLPLVFSERGRVFKINSFLVEYELSPKTIFQTKSNEFIENPDGIWHKLSIESSGVYKLTFENLKDWGVITSEVSIDEIAIIGKNGDQLPYINDQTKSNRLKKIPIQFFAGNDNIFNSGDYILFYAETAKTYTYDQTSNTGRYDLNHYSFINFVFIGLNAEFANKIEHVDYSNEIVIDTIRSVNDFIHHENDWLNFIKSGRIWVGEDFQSENPRLFNFNIYNIDTNAPVNLKATLAARSTQTADNYFTIGLNNNQDIFNLPSVSTIYYNDYVRFKTFRQDYNIDTKNINLQFEYNFPITSSLAWVDNFTLNFKRNLIFNSPTQQHFYNFDITNDGFYNYQINTNSAIMLWNIRGYDDIEHIKGSVSNDLLNFTLPSSDTTVQIMFDVEHCFIPNYVEQIQFQNLWSHQSTELVIITPPEWQEEAIRLANLHEQEDNMSVRVTLTSDIYNHYASGRPEAAAIRNYIRQQYQNPGEDSLRFVLLFGNGSQDQRNINSQKKNFIPTYQSLNSTKLTTSFVSDDFFGLMDDNEGEFTSLDMLDLAVGRLPVSSLNEAKAIVDKIENYYKEPVLLRSYNDDWVQRIHFVADDGDSYEHMRQSESLSVLVDSTLSHLNISKTFLDNYTEINTTVKPRIEGAENSIKNAFKTGQLIINYTGHGGEYGWAGERVLTISDIHQLNNETYPVVITASCEFARFDTPKGKSAGEYILLEPKGGAIGLMTTVRLVFSIPNFRLNTAFYKTMAKYSKEQKTMYLGELFKDTKILNNGGTNDRNFTLLGDPALRLHATQPQLEIDEIIIYGNETDTIKALQKVTVKGKVLDSNTSFDGSFNGNISITLFDKKESKESLNNGSENSKFQYWDQGNLLTRSTAIVTEGRFSSDLIIPLDIRSNFGEGKLSIIASDNSGKILGGIKNDFLIGGIDSSKLNDQSGPEIGLYLNDSSFVFGNIINNPVTLLVGLSDSSGLNITQSEIGNDIAFTLDGDETNEVLLNDYFEPSLGDPTSGSISYPIGELNPGEYSIELKGYDNLNNPSKAYTEFLIEESAELALEHLLNYPNPFTNNTAFYFEQNQSEPVEFLIQIFTISGKEIKSIQAVHDGVSERVGPIQWDGKDEFGDEIGRGVYLYKLTVRMNGKTETLTNKLVILK